MDIPAELLGAHLDPKETDAVCLIMAAQGVEPLFADAQPGLAGFGTGKSVLLFEAEQHLFKQYLPSWSQKSGTCVSMGFGRAWQDALYWGLAFGSLEGTPASICFETIYGGSRVTIGKGKLGSGDGSIGAWAALYGHDYGLLTRGTYGTIDLSKPREDLAVLWGTPGRGVPASLLAESAGYKASGCMRCTTVENIVDAICAGYGCAGCAQIATSGIRDDHGMCRPRPSGGHCQEIRGVYIDWKGRLCGVMQQSWGAAGPSGGGPIKLQDGREIPLPEGACGVFAEDLKRYLTDGEVWAVAAPYRPWNKA